MINKLHFYIDYVYYLYGKDFRNSQFYHVIHEQLYLGIKVVEKLYRVSFCCESVDHSFIDRYGHKYTFMVGFFVVFLFVFFKIFFVKDKKSSIK